MRRLDKQVSRANVLKSISSYTQSKQRVNKWHIHTHLLHEIPNRRDMAQRKPRDSRPKEERKTLPGPSHTKQESHVCSRSALWRRHANKNRRQGRDSPLGFVNKAYTLRKIFIPHRQDIIIWKK